MEQKLVFFTSNLGGGGAEGVCIKVANALSKKGLKITILVQNLDNDQLSHRLHFSENVETLDCRSIRYGLGKLRRWVIENQPAKIVSFHYMLTVALVLVRASLPKINRFKIISRNINTISQIKKYDVGFVKKLIQGNLRDQLYKQSDIIINQCNGMRDDFIKNYPETKDKCVVIYNPSMDQIHDGSLSKDSDSSPYLIYAGRLEQQKSVDCAIRAFSKLCRDSDNIRFRLVGEGKMRQDLHQLCVELGIEDRVDFVGFCKDIEHHLSNAVFTVLSSRYEGFPNVLVESISLGTPVVSFDCPCGPNEIVIDGVNGFLVENQNTQDLYEKMKLAMTFPFSAEMVKSTAQRFSIEKVASEWETLLTLELN